mgnify:CR=1 FL=1
MSNKEILEKAIQKAIDARWKQPWVGVYKGLNHDLVTGELFAYWQYKDLMPFGYSVIGLIFDHKFAKALWGEQLVLERKSCHETFVVPKEGTSSLAIKPHWQYHLQQMVISEDPITYLGENI